MTWEEFASGVRTRQIGFMGEPNEVRPGRGEFHENPSSCICENPEAKARGDIGSKVQKEISTGEDTAELADEEPTEDEHDWIDLDYTENENGLGKELINLTDSDLGAVLKAEAHPELEEMFSD